VKRAALLVVIGTSGATSLPARMCQEAAARGITFLVLDPEETVFASLARSTRRGHVMRGPAGRLVPELVSALREVISSR
jgi:NAD-dependent deacetylase